MKGEKGKRNWGGREERKGKGNERCRRKNLPPFKFTIETALCYSRVKGVCQTKRSSFLSHESCITSRCRKAKFDRNASRTLPAYSLLDLTADELSQAGVVG